MRLTGRSCRTSAIRRLIEADETPHRIVARAHTLVNSWMGSIAPRFAIRLLALSQLSLVERASDIVNIRSESFSKHVGLEIEKAEKLK